MRSAAEQRNATGSATTNEPVEQAPPRIGAARRPAASAPVGANGE